MEQVQITMHRNFLEPLLVFGIPPEFSIGHHLETTVENLFVVDTTCRHALTQRHHRHLLFAVNGKRRIARRELLTKTALEIEKALGMRFVFLLEFRALLE